MSATPNSQGFAYWSARFAAHENLITDALMAEVAAHPGFTDAVYAHIRSCLVLQVSNPMASRLANDITRLFLGFIVLYLDAKDGLTRGAIRDLFVGMGLSSPGRAVAILMQLRTIKFIELNPEQHDRRTRRYIPTPAMKQAFIELMSVGLGATAIVEPAMAAIGERFADPLFFRAYALALGESVLGLAHSLKDAPRDMFADATAGYLMLYRLMIDANEGSTYPPRGSLPVGRTALSDEFRISRSHVRRVFENAAARGLIAYNADRTALTLTEEFRGHLVRYHAAMFLNNIRCVQGALAQVRAAATEAA